MIPFVWVSSYIFVNKHIFLNKILIVFWTFIDLMYLDTILKNFGFVGLTKLIFKSV